MRDFLTDGERQQIARTVLGYGSASHYNIAEVWIHSGGRAFIAPVLQKSGPSLKLPKDPDQTNSTKYFPQCP